MIEIINKIFDIWEKEKEKGIKDTDIQILISLQDYNKLTDNGKYKSVNISQTDIKASKYIELGNIQLHTLIYN